jgi:phosphopantothenoylcysteine decarboxylase/phosphopantothenate--cysteine ligase
MDEDMWHQPAVQESLAWLRKQGTFVIGPVSGALASGLAGMGRMVEPSDIVRRLCDILGDWDVRSTALRGKRVLITGGPTYEPIDAVRFIGNRSSGKMAAALAEAARAMGADVTLIMGPSVIGTNGTVQRIDVETAEEMLNAVRAEFSKADILIMAAAVADFAPANVSNTKLKKQEMERLPFASPQSYTIELRPTPDILSEIARTKRKDQIVVGFALEKGEKATDYARSKLKEKNLDMIVLNNIADEGAGFSYDTNKVTIFTRDGTSESLPLLSKEECAISILEHIQELYSRSSD